MGLSWDFTDTSFERALFLLVPSGATSGPHLHPSSPLYIVEILKQEGISEEDPDSQAGFSFSS